jgi:squalene synthase HpnC
VALRLLPSRYRLHLRAVYDTVRVIDDLGDEASGDRAAQLRVFAAQLSLLWHGGMPDEPVLYRLAPTVWARRLSQRPFEQLIEANQRDQTVHEYASYDDLLGYCALSANPVGHLVLEIFGVRSPGREVLSDHICTALQLLEHCQDIAEDYRNGRVYLPAADRAAHGVTEADLAADVTSDRLRRAIAAQVDRAVCLLDAGAPLLEQLPGWSRLAVAGYLAGGYAAADALSRAEYRVVPTHPRVPGKEVLKHFMFLLSTSDPVGRRRQKGLTS